MKVAEVVKLLNGTLITDLSSDEEGEFLNAFSSDLMSDVLRLVSEKTILITGLCNIQTVRTAEMAEIKLIILGRNKKADAEMIALAKENGTAIIESKYSIFKIGGILYDNGIVPIY